MNGDSSNEHEATKQPQPEAVPEAAAPDGGEQGAAPPEAEVAELKDRVLRTLAEMENLRRRTQREVEEARRFAVTGFARDLLEVGDNLGRALASVPVEARESSDFVKNLVLGVEMTQRALLSAFEKHQVRRVEPRRGDRFDHNLHQAMFEVPSAELAPGTVAEVVQAGYVIADRLLRPALVGVAKAAGHQPAAGDGGPAGPGTTTTSARVDTVA